MCESAAASFAAYERVQEVLDTASSAIAGFALLAGARAFTFVALFAWREPVLGGAGLMLLAAIGCVRWCCLRNQSLTRSLDVTKVLAAVVTTNRRHFAIGGFTAMQTTNPVASTIHNNTSSSGNAAASSSRNSNAPSFADVLAQLTDYEKGTPGERMEKMILAKLGLTEDDLKQMSPEEREKVMTKVRNMIKQQIDAQKHAEETKKGVKIDVAI